MKLIYGAPGRLLFYNNNKRDPSMQHSCDRPIGNEYYRAIATRVFLCELHALHTTRTYLSSTLVTDSFNRIGFEDTLNRRDRYALWM